MKFFGLSCSQHDLGWKLSKFEDVQIENVMYFEKMKNDRPSFDDLII